MILGGCGWWRANAQSNLELNFGESLKFINSAKGENKSDCNQWHTFSFQLVPGGWQKVN